MLSLEDTAMHKIMKEHSLEDLVGKALRLSPSISKRLLKKYLMQQSLYFLPSAPPPGGTDNPPAEANRKRKREVQPPFN